MACVVIFMCTAVAVCCGHHCAVVTGAVVITGVVVNGAIVITGADITGAVVTGAVVTGGLSLVPLSECHGMLSYCIIVTYHWHIGIVVIM